MSGMTKSQDFEEPDREEDASAPFGFLKQQYMVALELGGLDSLALAAIPAGATIAVVASDPDTAAATLPQARHAAAHRILIEREATPGGRGDPFAPGPRALALLAGRKIAEDDLRLAGGTFDLDQVRALTGITRQAVDKRVREGSIIAVPGPSRRRRYPTMQFRADGTIVPGLKAVVEALPSKNPWVVLNYLVRAEPRLGGERPIDRLGRGDVRTVVEAARGLGEQGG